MSLQRSRAASRGQEHSYCQENVWSERLSPAVVSLQADSIACKSLRKSSAKKEEERKNQKLKTLGQKNQQFGLPSL
jgi:hypothetical protein